MLTFDFEVKKNTMLSMNKNTKTVFIVVLSILVILLVARVVFNKQFDEWGNGLKKIEIWQDQYKKDHPNATEDDMNTAFKSGMQGLETWKKGYLLDHPDATDTEVEAAFNAIWDKK